MPDPTDLTPGRDFLALTEAYIETWHGIPAPNDSARRLAAELAATIRGFEAQRHRLRFEDEPSSFEAALADMAEPEPGQSGSEPEPGA